MANEFIVRKGYIALEDSQITGSLSVTNSVTASFFTGSYRGDGSQLTGIEGFPFTGSAQITGSLGVTGSMTATTFIGDGSQLTGIDGFPFTGSAAISGSLTVDGNVVADSFTGSLQGIATSASYVQLANIDGFTAYSASVNTAIDSVLDATTPLTATVNTTNSPFTITSQSIVIIDSTNGDVTVNLPDLDTINGTPSQKPILLYKNDYSQNVVYVEPSGSQLVNGTTQDIIVSIQIGIVYNPTSAGWVTEGTSYQSLAELELFFVPRTETGSLSVATASYVEYENVANKPAIVSGSSQISFNGITDKPTLVSGSEQITYSGLTGIPSGILSGSAQIADFGIFATTGSNQFNGNQSITGSLTVSGQVVAQTLNVQQVTSSIVYSSGSNVFGNSLSNTQQFTGSVSITGSLTVNGQGYFGSTNYSNVIVDGTNATGWGNNIAFRSQGTDFGYLGSIGSLLGNTTKDMAIWATSGNGIRFYTNGNNLRATIDTSGNLGLGVTPSAWQTLYGSTAIQMLGSYIYGYRDTNLIIGNNAYYDGTWKYYASGVAATKFNMGNGAYDWSIAPSGTAGNAISFNQAMTLTSDGNLYVGNTSFTSPNGADKFIGVYGGQDASLILQDNVQLWELYVNDDFYITSGATPRLTINRSTGAATFSSSVTANGNILINNTTTTALTLNPSSSSFQATIYFAEAGSNKWEISKTPTTPNLDFYSYTSNSSVLRLTSGGNVGINQTGPSARLEVVPQNAGGNEGIFINQLGSHQSTIRFKSAHDANSDYRIGASILTSSAFEIFSVNANATRMRIASNGNVIIGPSSVVDLGSIMTIDGNVNLTNGANRLIYIGSATNYNYQLRTEGDDFAIREAGITDRLRYSYTNVRWTITGGLTISGSLSKGSGSFRIDHPLPSKKATHKLVHSFIEGPQADNIYRGKIELVNGRATVNLDQAATMTEGTFVLLNGNIQCFTSNESGWSAIKGNVEGNILTIEAQDSNCTDTISWLVIGERIDQHMLDTDWTDENGKVIVEPLATT